MAAPGTSTTIVALSGGVDSAVAASLLIDQGHAVQGLFMSNWEEDETGYCRSAEDFQDAKRIAAQLGIALHRASFARAYRDRVFAQFLEEYRAGRTPNPDVLCNREIKFGACFEYTRRLGAGLFATGHYARIGRSDGKPALLRAADAVKDQTYFLHAIDPALLANVLFPIGDLQKSEVRAYARERGLAVHDKKDSTGICFIGERPFAEFLGNFLPPKPGAIESESGAIVGRHLGLMYYTLGQRQGLRIGGRQGASEQPWYVAAKDIERNVLTVVQGPDHPRLLSTATLTGPLHWLTRSAPPTGGLSAQIRHRQRPVAVDFDGRPDGTALVSFREPQRAVAPGQFLVLYAGEHCLGGAVIREARPLTQPSITRRAGLGTA